MAPGRRRIRTVVKSESRREQVSRFGRAELDKGRQAYVVYPVVEESSKVDLRAATEMADHLQQDVFPAYRVALLHGRMKPDEKDRVMHAFARGEFHILVSTTVVEVGVDVPNASVMVVEHAERFGLSQLHQLRGRVGRAAHQSYCVLLYQAPLNDAGRERLKALTDTTDGFVIAERDLALRGPGDFFGTRQSGMPTLRVGDLLRDHQLIAEADIAFNKAVRLMQGGRAQRDPAQAACFLHEAAALGHPRAQYNLVLMYLKGLGVSKSLNESLRWLEVAARSREPHALALLALFDPKLAISLGAPAELVPMPEVDPLDPDGLQSGSAPTAAAPQAESGWKRTRRWMLRIAA